MEENPFLLLEFCPRTQAAQDMYVNMIYFLTTVMSGVDHDAEAVIYPLLLPTRAKASILPKSGSSALPMTAKES